MAEKLEPGWYWVKDHSNDPRGGRQEVAYFGPDGEWRKTTQRISGEPAIIGPRIEPPGGE